MESKEHFEMFVLTIVAFMLLVAKTKKMFM